MTENNIKIRDSLYPIDAVMKSIYLDEAKSIGIDIAENGIDSLFESELLKDIPIVKMVHSVSKISLAIRDKYFLKKTLTFIAAFNQGNAKIEEIEKRRRAAENNEEWLRKEIELLTIHLDRLDELEKAKITAAFYVKYINGSISWYKCREYLAVIERVFFQDFIQLLEIYDAFIQEQKVKKVTEKWGGAVISKSISQLNCDRLLAVGLVTTTLDTSVKNDYILSALGEKFAEVLKEIGWDKIKNI
ncbi:hypothetical protein [Clostridium botulinum]|uniref:hypothetical protein n=1 Tax=Clostridium botulinum TaxID=1491 RepID=UPI003DA3F380